MEISNYSESVIRESYREYSRNPRPLRTSLSTYSEELEGTGPQPVQELGQLSQSQLGPLLGHAQRPLDGWSVGRGNSDPGAPMDTHSS
jgi:hypothetical protein